MSPARVGTFADTTSALEAKISMYQICGVAPKSQAVAMSFFLDAVWVDGTIVMNSPVNYMDPWGLVIMRSGVSNPPAGRSLCS